MNSSHNTELLDEVELLGAADGDQLQLRFEGPFEGGQVRWNATLFTPTAWAQHFNEALPSRNIILIEDGDSTEFVLSICLKVPRIDRPTIRKAVMMVRQYKRLQRGRHEYG